MLLILRNRLKYALNVAEANAILMQRLVKVDGKVRTEKCYPCGFMDVVSFAKNDENFRLVFDTKGRFKLLPIDSEEAQYKLCKVKKLKLGDKGIPLITTHDGRTIRYPDPLIKELDTVAVNIATNKIATKEGLPVVLKLDVGNLCMVTGGRNTGRVGIITSREKHKGSFDIIHVKDLAGNGFATRLTNVFVIGNGNKPYISLPSGSGIKLSIVEEMMKRKEA